MDSIGYKNINVSSYNKLEKVFINKGEVEIICGDVASGKTVAMINYLYSHNNCVYISSRNIDGYLDKDNESIGVFVNRDNVDFINSPLDLNQKPTVNIIINNIEFLNIDDKIKYLKSIIKYCNHKSRELLIDLTEPIQTYIDLIKDIEVPCHISHVSSKNNPNFKNLVNINNLKLTFYNYKVLEKLKQSTLEINSNNYSGEISLKIPKSLHKELVLEAKNIEGVSLNQYIGYILASRLYK